MGIVAPGKRLNPTIQRRTVGRKSVQAGLFLTSMVDMFAIMVIFLLQSFSAEGEIIVLPRGLELPKAANTGTLERAPVITVGLEEILFEGEKVANTRDLIQSDSWDLPPLRDRLAEYRQQLEAEAAVVQTEEGEDPVEQAEENRQKINISADRRLEFEVVKKVIYNAGFSGFPDFRFAVFTGNPNEEESAE